MVHRSQKGFERNDGNPRGHQPESSKTSNILEDHTYHQDSQDSGRGAEMKTVQDFVGRGNNPTSANERVAAVKRSDKYLDLKETRHQASGDWDTVHTTSSTKLERITARIAKNDEEEKEVLKVTPKKSAWRVKEAYAQKRDYLYSQRYTVLENSKDTKRDNTQKMVGAKNGMLELEEDARRPEYYED